MQEDANVILNEFYDIQTSKEKLETFIEKYKEVSEAQPVLNMANQALENITVTPQLISKIDKPEKEKPEIKLRNVRHTILETKSDNPLMQYFRPPGVYVVLPSAGNFYKADPELTSLGEVLIKPMTAKDELLFKSPDILMNGESLIEVIKSCVPGIQNPREIPTPDFNVIMLALRLATYGKDLPYIGKCRECSKNTEFIVDIEQVLDTQITKLQKQYKIDIDQLTVYVKPYDIHCQTRSSIASFEQQAITNSILGNDDLTDSEKTLEFSRSFNKITEITYELILHSIIKISTPNEDIVDPQLIAEWLFSVGKKIFESITEKILESTNKGFNNDVVYECEHCKLSNTTPIIFDPTSFFD
jgi:hypothetical protein